MTSRHVSFGGRYKKMTNKMTDPELLNWARCQLLRAARTLELFSVLAGDGVESPIAAQGCDLTADAIEQRLREIPGGLEMMRNTTRNFDDE